MWQNMLLQSCCSLISFTLSTDSLFLYIWFQSKVALQPWYIIALKINTFLLWRKLLSSIMTNSVLSFSCTFSKLFYGTFLASLSFCSVMLMPSWIISTCRNFRPWQNLLTRVKIDCIKRFTLVIALSQWCLF